jgi:hypothetical protein
MFGRGKEKMIRFVDLGKQLGLDAEWPRQFCFFDTIYSSFLSFDGEEVWENWEDCETAIREESKNSSADLNNLEPYIARLKSLTQKWAFSETVDK